MMSKSRVENWSAYFANNRHNLIDVAWDHPYELSAAERETIRRSIQQFQLGESSDGERFIQLAEEYADESDDMAYLPAQKLFIREEQRHSADLGRFMQSQGIPLLRHHPVDGMFRLLRHLMNLEMAIVVLLSAEVVAVPYYKALHDATQSPTLRDICRQILRDEIQHLNFQSETLAKLRARRSRIGLWITRQLERILFAGTLVVVWIGHHRVYRAGGFSLSRFWRANWSRFEHSFARAHGEV